MATDRVADLFRNIAPRFFHALGFYHAQCPEMFKEHELRMLGSRLLRRVITDFFPRELQYTDGKDLLALGEYSVRVRFMRSHFLPNKAIPIKNTKGRAALHSSEFDYLLICLDLPARNRGRFIRKKERFTFYLMSMAQVQRLAENDGKGQLYLPGAAIRPNCLLVRTELKESVYERTGIRDADPANLNRVCRDDLDNMFDRLLATE